MVAETEENNTFPLTNNIYVKIRFKSSAHNLYGLLLINFNPNGQIDSYNVVVSTFSNLFEIEPQTAWDEFENAVIDYRWKGNYNTNMTTALLHQIDSMNKEDYQRVQLFESLQNYDYTAAETTLFDAIHRVIHDKDLHLEMGIQEVSQTEIAEVKQKRNQAQEKELEIQKTSNVTLKEGSTIIETSLILAPVRGKPLYELKIGDKIMQRIEPNSEQANYFIDYYKLRLGEKIKPIPAEVIDIKAESKNDPVQIITRIDETLYGKCTEDERQVKLRLYDPRIDGTMFKPTTKSTSQEFSPLPVENEGLSPVMYALLTVFALLLAVFIILIYILI